MKAESWSELFLCLPNGRFRIKHSEALKARYPPSLCADTFLVRSGTDPPAVSSDCPARAPMTGHYHLTRGAHSDWGQRFIQGCLPSAVWGWEEERKADSRAFHGLHPSGSRPRSLHLPVPRVVPASSQLEVQPAAPRADAARTPQAGPGARVRGSSAPPPWPPSARTPHRGRAQRPAAAPGSRLDGQGPLAAPARSLAPGPCPFPPPRARGRG